MLKNCNISIYFYLKLIVFYLFLSTISENLLSQENTIHSFSIYKRKGFQTDWLETIWTSENAKKITFPYEGILPIRVGEDKNQFVFFSKADSIREATIQIQIPKDKIQLFQNPGFLVSRLGENWTIYQNNQILAQKMDLSNGKILKEHTTVNRIISINATNLIDGYCLLNIRIIGNPDSPRSALILSPDLTLAEISTLVDHSIEFIPFLLISLFTFLGFYMIYLYIRMRKYDHVLYYGLFLLGYAIFTFTQSKFIYSLFEDTHRIYQIEILALGFSISSIIFFMDSFLLYQLSKFNQIIVGLICIVALLAIFLSYHFLFLLEWYTVLETISLVFYIRVGYRNYKKDKKRRMIQKERYPFFKYLTKNKMGIIFLNIIVLAIAIYFETFLNWYFNIKTPIVILTSLGLFMFMTIFIIQKMEDAFLSQEKVKLSHKEEKKRLNLEKELSIRNERQKAFIDIHDEIGVDLSFLRIRISEYLNKEIIPKWEGNELLEFVMRISKGIRYRLQLLEDEKYLKEEFFFAIRLLLLRKYEYVNRRIEFVSNLKDDIKQFLNDTQVESLYKITREIANNDIKYGQGISSWSFTQYPRYLEMNFLATSLYEPKKENIGYGWKNILSIVDQINGSIKSEQKGDQFSLQFTIPMTR